MSLETGRPSIALITSLVDATTTHTTSPNVTTTATAHSERAAALWVMQASDLFRERLCNALSLGGGGGCLLERSSFVLSLSRSRAKSGWARAQGARANQAQDNRCAFFGLLMLA